MEKLVGNWMGFFEDGSGYRVSFLAAIENIAYGTFIGRAKDNIIEKDDEYTSVIGGKLNDDDVVFRKSYTSIDADVVFYYGKLNERKITGTWYTQKDTLCLGGKFEMWQLGAVTGNRNLTQSGDNLINSTETK
jgi:hypothetical protein